MADHQRRRIPAPTVPWPLWRERRHGARCRVCGCTELEACPEGCWWVAEDLCSSCVGKAERKEMVAGG